MNSIWRALSEAEHVVQAEAAFATLHAMITEESAGFVPHNDIGMGPGARQNLLVEDVLDAPQARAGGRNCHLAMGNLFPVRCAERKPRLRPGMPSLRDRIDEVAERLPWRRRDPQEQARRQPWRRARIGLRFAAIGEGDVEHVRAEACFGRMAALFVAIAEERMQ